MNETCKNCTGEGIVGMGDQPWLRQGHLHTCEVCGGTGKINNNENKMNEETNPPQEGEGKKEEQVEPSPEVGGESVPAEPVVPAE